jgi:hypothetical protein
MPTSLRSDCPINAPILLATFRPDLVAIFTGIHMLILRSAFSFSHVGLRALNGPDLDITSAQGKLMLNVLSAISEFERDLLGERIKSGVAHARCKGTKSGKASSPFLSSKVQQFADFFLMARNLRIEVIDVF